MPERRSLCITVKYDVDLEDEDLDLEALERQLARDCVAVLAPVADARVDGFVDTVQNEEGDYL